MPMLIGVLTLPHRRAETSRDSINATRVRNIIEEAGGSVAELYWAIAPDQLFVIVATPTETSAAAVRLALSKLRVPGLSATTVFSTEEYLQVRLKAGESVERS